jgi:hypothetical protein
MLVPICKYNAGHPHKMQCATILQATTSGPSASKQNSPTEGRSQFRSKFSESPKSFRKIWVPFDRGWGCRSRTSPRTSSTCRRTAPWRRGGFSIALCQKTLKSVRWAVVSRRRASVTFTRNWKCASQRPSVSATDSPFRRLLLQVLQKFRRASRCKLRRN